MEVGAKLYEIDTGAAAAVDASSSPPPSAAPTTKQSDTTADAELTTTSDSKVASKQTSGHRTPSIHFRGKDGWAQIKIALPSPVQYVDLPPSYGRLKFTELEMEAIMVGGANLAPDLAKMKQ